MRGWLGSRLSYANVMATIAIFVALGGSSYAVATRVTGKQIVDNTVRSADLRNNDVRSGDVRNGTLTPGDFKRGALPAGAPGPAGPQGVQGPPGQPGTPGASATRLFAHVTEGGALGYGSGVTAVSRPATGDYRVTFSRSLAGCVAVANPGFGIGVGGGTDSRAQVRPNVGVGSDHHTVRVDVDDMDDPDATIVPDNTNFHLAVFC